MNESIDQVAQELALSAFDRPTDGDAIRAGIAERDAGTEFVQTEEDLGAEVLAQEDEGNDGLAFNLQ